MLIIGLIISFLMPFQMNDHDFKMSVCEVIPGDSANSTEVKFYLFTDDLKEVIYGDPDAPKLHEDRVREYILAGFHMNSNGTAIPMTFKSLENKNDQVLVRFLTDVLPSGKLTVRNSLLTEKFRTQVNMVYLIKPDGSKLTRMLNASQKEGLFTW